MDLEQIKSELSNKTIEELAKTQEECMLTIRPCLVALTEKVEIDVSKSFFLFCMSCVGCDKVVSINEYNLIKHFIKVDVTQNDVQQYVDELLNTNALINFSKELVSLVRQVSNEGYEEIIKFAVCFLLSDEFNDDKQAFLESIANIN